MKCASFVMLGAFGGLAACASIPQPSIAPYQTRAGGLGFTMQGLAQFTNDQAAIELTAREALKQACNADPAVLVQRGRHPSRRVSLSFRILRP